MWGLGRFLSSSLMKPQTIEVCKPLIFLLLVVTSVSHPDYSFSVLFVPTQVAVPFCPSGSCVKEAAKHVLVCRLLQWKRDGSGTEIAHLVTDKSILKLHSTLYCNSFQILLCDCRVAQCHEVLEQFSSWSFLPLHICALSAHFVLHHPLPGPLRKAE